MSKLSSIHICHNYVMILFSLYLTVIITATLLVQSLHSARWDNINKRFVITNPDGLIMEKNNAFSQSKGSVRQFVSNKNVFNKEKMRKLLRKRETVFNHPTIDLQDLLNELIQNFDRVRRSHKNSNSNNNNNNRRHVKSGKKRSHLKKRWDPWTDWSACSVSCGKGREIRWRHCLHDCDGVETEMEEKTCQLPACGGKLFGLIKL